MPYADKAKKKAWDKRYREEHLEQVRATARKWQTTNREHVRDKQKKWKDTNLWKLQSYGRQRLYGISEFDCNRLHDLQEWSCAICRQTPEELDKRTGRMKAKSLHTDHNHKTGKVRGFLCSTCNTGLGNFRDSIDNLRNAIQYLLDTQ
jgi:hypothetical protein